MSVPPRRIILSAGLQDFCVLAGLLTLILYQIANFADDPGVGWHLKMGEILSAGGGVPGTDPFLHSPTPRPWVSDQWFSDIILYRIFAAGSWELLYATLAAIYLVTFFGILYRGVSRITGSCLGASFAVFLAFKSAELHFILRPVLAGFLFFSAVYIMIYEALHEFRSGQTHLGQRIFFYVTLPMVFLVWANAHPSFVLGLLLIPLLIAALLLDFLFFAEELRASLFIRLLLLLVLCIGATLINPYGIELHRSIYALSHSRYFMSLHAEWMSPDFKLPEGEFFLLTMGVIFLSLFLAGGHRLRWGFFEFLLVSVFGVLALRSVRILPFFGIAASVPLVYALRNIQESRIFDFRASFRRLSKGIFNLEQREKLTSQGFLVLALAVVALVADAVYNGRVLLFQGPFGPTLQKFPYGNVLELKTNSSLAHAVVAAPPEWGGFITYFGRTGIKPLIDDRNTLLGEAFYQEFYDKMRPGEKLIPYLHRLGATHLLINRSSPLVPWVRDLKLMQELGEDPASVLFALEGPAASEQ